ncbi:MAG: 4Fe-4S binding protein [Acidobacteriaceae bacterium]|nr:4Fe-4S binding protein [Acidobacteriaceae bacterium]
MDSHIANGTASRKEKPTLVRRAGLDRSQQIRHAVQGLFAALNLWIGAQFYLWVRNIESGGAAGMNVSRPAGAEGWLPIAGMMNAKYLLLTGHVPALHPAAMFLFLAFLLMSLLLKKAFCSWLCPIGTFSEFLWRMGRRVFKRTLRLPRWIDVPLRGLKYLLLGFFIFVIGMMSVESLLDFMRSPYGMIVDVKMLNFFRHMSATAAIVVVLLAALSLVIQNVWCRYLCPYGALMGIASLLSPIKIRRDKEACIDCAKCARDCPSLLPVDRLTQVRSAECNACMICVASCPAQNALQLALPPRRAGSERWLRRTVTPLTLATALVCIFFGAVLYARATGHWQTNIPRSVYEHLVLHADEASHPGM